MSARLCVKVGVENHAAESCLQQGFCQFAAVSLHRTSCYPVSLRYHQSLTCYAVSSVKASYYHLFFLTALLFGGDINPAHPKHIGSIDPNCNVAEVVKDAYETAKMLCEQYYLVAPDLEVEEFNAKAPNKPIQVVYVPSHLFHMLFELFKVGCAY